MPSFVKPENIIAQAGLQPGITVADFGCGSGFYTLSLAKAVGPSGHVFAVDLLDDKISATLSAGRNFGLSNIKGIKADLDLPMTQINQGSCDVVMLGNILHQVKQTDGVLRNAYAVLKTEGVLIAVEWKPVASPFGPPQEKRISEKDLEAKLEAFHFKKLKDIPTDSYHYAIVFKK